jgi:fatty acid amide hydrolase
MIKHFPSIGRIKMRHKKLALLALAIAAGTLIKSFLSSKSSAKHAATLSEKARKRKLQTSVAISLSAGLPEISPGLSAKILRSSIPKLQKSLNKRKITCKDIFLSYIHSLRRTSSQYNCIIDIDIESGLRRAEKLDVELQSGHKRSSLHGIPISVKDNIAVKGLALTYGCAAQSFNIATEDAYIVKVLKKKGALIFVKGTVPQVLGSIETVNNITGVALNPVDIERSPGGSSGGDAGLVASYGVCLGVGTDLLGSIRFPAASCGLFSLKPTVDRVSRSGPFILQDYPMLRNSYGPLARNIEDLICFCREVFNEHPFPLNPHLPFKEEVLTSTEPLTVSYCYGSHYWPVPDCMKRAVNEAKTRLEQKGHRTVELVLENELQEAFENTIPLFLYESGTSDIRQGEENKNQSHKIKQCFNTPNCLKGLYEWYIRKQYGEKESYLYKVLNHKTCKDFFEQVVNFRLLKKRIMDKIQQIEANIILFPIPYPAILHNTTADLYPGICYYLLFNMLDFPAGTVPMGKIEVNEQKYEVESDEMWVKAMKATMNNSVGLPISVQVAGLPYQEEEVLRIMKELA